MKKTILILLIIHCSLLIVRAQWIQQNSGTNQNLYDIEFINDKTGWAVGDAGVVIKTTNGGTNWLNIPNPSGQYGGLLWSVCPVDSEVVYIVAGYDFIMKTNNGGTNWNLISGRPGSITAFKSVFFLNRDTGWFLGTNKVFRTYDGANTLDSFYAPWFTNSDIYFKDINTGIFCGDGRVFKSIDRGETWFNTNVPVGGTFYMFRKLAVLGENVWIADGIVFKSANFCETWKIPDSMQSVSGSAINFINKDTGFAGGGSNRLYKTVNGGYNWIRQRTDSLSFAFISSIDFVNDSVGWYSCGAGKIYKTTTGGQFLTKIITTTTEIPVKYILYQNYPNPFNPVTKIRYDLPFDGKVSIRIYDINGRLISSLINENKTAGRYEMEFNGDNLSSGVYYYKIESGSFYQVRKMILIK